MSVPHNLIYIINATPIKISASSFADINKLILKFIWRGKRPRRANPIWKEEKRVRESTLLDFKNYYKATVTRTM